MKSQYFGDNKDLFKYDLILRVIEETSSISHFTFIPMLTRNDGKGHGEDDDRAKAKAGTKNEDLVNFLDECRRKDRRDIKQLESFFKDKAFNITVYKKDTFFPSEPLEREEYFEQIEDKLLSKSLVFVDPDKGLQVTKSGKEHILYSEVTNLYEHMDKSSILMIFQYFPRDEKHERYLDRRSKELKDKITGDLPIYICDKKIIFFFLTKDKPLRESLAKTISEYKRDYPELRVGNVR